MTSAASAIGRGATAFAAAPDSAGGASDSHRRSCMQVVTSPDGEEHVASFRPPGEVVGFEAVSGRRLRLRGRVRAGQRSPVSRRLHVIRSASCMRACAGALLRDRRA